MKTIFARAPVRICDIGGWTDTWFCKGGAVFNFCIDLYSYVRIYPQETPGIDIISENLDLTAEIKEYRKIEYDGTLDLLKSAIKAMHIEQGLTIYARSDAPPGCGTGTSASIAVAMIGALMMLKGQYHVRHEIAELAHALETDELKLQSGVQDQYASVYGGFNFMDIEYPRVKVSRIDVKDEMTWQLEQQLILVYLGSRSSSSMHEAVIDNYENNDGKTLVAFDTLKRAARDIVIAIHDGDIERFGEVMNMNWAAQKVLHPLITTPAIGRLERIACNHGAIGFKVNGAGGGGSAVILAGTGKEYELKRAILAAGYEILPFKVNHSGLQAWTR